VAVVRGAWTVRERPNERIVVFGLLMALLLILIIASR
jgi:hypothetical protein